MRCWPGQVALTRSPVACARYEEEEADGTDSTVYSTAVALAIMGCFQVSLPHFCRNPGGNQVALCRRTRLQCIGLKYAAHGRQKWP